MSSDREEALSEPSDPVDAKTPGRSTPGRSSPVSPHSSSSFRRAGDTPNSRLAGEDAEPEGEDLFEGQHERCPLTSECCSL